MSFHFPEKSSCSSKHSEFFELEPSQKPSNPESISTSSAIQSSNGSHSMGIVRKSKPRNLSLPDERMVMSLEHNFQQQANDEVDGNPLRLLRQSKGLGGTNNVLPLPPRDRFHKPVLGAVGGSQFPRHQRKHPLLVPSKIPMSEFTGTPPPPPPKPIRQNIKTQEPTSNELNGNLTTTTESETTSIVEEDSNNDERPPRPTTAATLMKEGLPKEESVLSAVIESLRRNQSLNTFSNTADKIKLYENFETSCPDEPSQTPELLKANLEPTPMKPRIPRGDSPSKASSQDKNSNPFQPVHNRRVASLDLAPNLNSELNSSKKSNFETNFQPDHDLLKIRTVRRILGSSVSSNFS